MSKSESAAAGGQPTHSPKIRIRGTASGEVVDQYRARLGAFHERHQQQAKISGNPQYTAKVSWPGARAIYHNNNGQETITMIVDEVPGGGEEHPVKQAPWDFALIDFIIRNVGSGRVHFSAFLAKPQTTAEKAMTATTFMPVQGVTNNRDAEADKPLLALANNVSASEAIGDVIDQDFYASLRVDLRPFPFQTIEVDVYGFIEPYNETGLPRPGGTVTASTFYGSVALDISGITAPQTVGQWTSLVPEDTVHMALAGDGPFDILVSLFPELSGKSHVFGGGDTGQVSVSFAWNHVTNVWEGDPSLVSPTDNPSAFMISGAAHDVEIDWAPGFPKSIETIGMTVEYAIGGGGPTPANSVDTPPVPPDSGQAVTVAYRDITTYYVPTVQYVSPAPFEVQAVMARNGNPWTKVSFRESTTINDSGRWEVEATYPDRPAMKAITGGFMPSQSRDFAHESSPFAHFGMPKMGTLKIDSRSGGVKFVPV